MRLYCANGRCRNKPVSGFWLCTRCAKKDGNCPVDGKHFPFFVTTRRVRENMSKVKAA